MDRSLEPQEGRMTRRKEEESRRRGKEIDKVRERKGEIYRYFYWGQEKKIMTTSQS